jgi:hypothetical protein
MCIKTIAFFSILWEQRHVLPIACKAVTLENSIIRQRIFKVGHHAQVAGQYVAAGRVTPPAARALSEDLAKALWDESCKLTGIAPRL